MGKMVINKSFIQVFEGLAMLLAELDVLLSFADLAASSPTPYTRPEITPSVTILHFSLYVVKFFKDMF